MTLVLSQQVQEFIAEHRHGVISTFGKNRAAHLTVVTHGLYQGTPAFTSNEGLVKLFNLKRDSRCSFLVMSPNGRTYVTLEGRAEVYAPGESDAQQLRKVLREIYRAAARKEHPDWDDYVRAMLEKGRHGVLVVPERMYHNLGKYT